METFQLDDAKYHLCGARTFDLKYNIDLKQKDYLIAPKDSK